MQTHARTQTHTARRRSHLSPLAKHVFQYVRGIAHSRVGAAFSLGLSYLAWLLLATHPLHLHYHHQHQPPPAAVAAARRRRRHDNPGWYTRAGVFAMELAFTLGVIGLCVCGCFIAAKQRVAMPGNIYGLAAGTVLTGMSWCFHAALAFIATATCVIVATVVVVIAAVVVAVVLGGPLSSLAAARVVDSWSEHVAVVVIFVVARLPCRSHTHVAHILLLPVLLLLPLLLPPVLRLLLLLLLLMLRSYVVTWEVFNESTPISPLVVGEYIKAVSILCVMSYVAAVFSFRHLRMVRTPQLLLSLFLSERCGS